VSYRYTRDQKYLDASLRLARNFIPQLDAAVVPVWDFRLPPDAAPIRDALAAAVAVCGFQELQKLGVVDELLLKTKDALLQRICCDDYLDSDENCRGVLKSAYGNKVAFSSWGDYFLMEAVAREIFQTETWW
jgi:unsaturated chondroitin disaccharide hydrolase